MNYSVCISSIRRPCVW